MAALEAAEYQGPLMEMTAAAMPVTFAGTVGLFMPAATPARQTAVLFLSPWGFEEMCVRKFWRILAEDFAKAGIASLRFDYAGTGDALDVADPGEGLALWEGTALSAAAMLRSLSGCERLILVSQGLGSVVALDIAEQLSAIDGIALLAPTISGRAYLRELTVWSKMIDEGMGLTETQRRTEGVTIASLQMPDVIAATVKKLNLMTRAQVGAPDCLVLTRPGRPVDADFAGHLETLCPRVERGAYDGYDELVSNPTIATMPLEAGRKILDWAQSITTEPTTASRKILRAPRAEALIGDGFRRDAAALR